MISWCLCADLSADFISFSSLVLSVHTGQMYSFPALSILLPWFTEIPTQSPWNHSSQISQQIMNLCGAKCAVYVCVCVCVCVCVYLSNYCMSNNSIILHVCSSLEAFAFGRELNTKVYILKPEWLKGTLTLHTTNRLVLDSAFRVVNSVLNNSKTTLCILSVRN